MSTVRKSLEQICREGGGRVDRNRLDAFSDTEVETMAAEDETSEPDADADPVQVVRPVQRDKTGT